MKETHAAASHEQLQRVGGTLLQHFMKDCILLCLMSGFPMPEEGRNVRNKEEQQRGAVMSCLQPPFLILLY